MTDLPQGIHDCIPERDYLRFWSKVDKTDGCWLWTSSITSGGYGNFRMGASTRYAHRLSYVAAKGVIPDGYVIDHLCRVRHCVNPKHLEAVPHKVNVQRGLSPYGLRTECRHGHDITIDGAVYTSPSGEKRCRLCSEAREASRRVPNWPPKRCPQGHLFTEENTSYTPKGHRRCKACNREKSRQRYHSKKATS